MAMLHGHYPQFFTNCFGERLSQMVMRLETSTCNSNYPYRRLFTRESHEKWNISDGAVFYSEWPEKRHFVKLQSLAGSLSSSFFPSISQLTWTLIFFVLRSEPCTINWLWICNLPRHWEIESVQMRVITLLCGQKEREAKVSLGGIAYGVNRKTRRFVQGVAWIDANEQNVTKVVVWRLLSSYFVQRCGQSYLHTLPIAVWSGGACRIISFEVLQ